MSERVVAIFKRLDEDAHSRMSFAQASPEEGLQLMIGLVRRAALVGLTTSLGEDVIDNVAARLVDMILKLRDEAQKDKRVS